MDEVLDSGPSAPTFPAGRSDVVRSLSAAPLVGVVADTQPFGVVVVRCSREADVLVGTVDQELLRRGNVQRRTSRGDELPCDAVLVSAQRIEDGPAGNRFTWNHRENGVAPELLDDFRQGVV